ncbi:helix-turn-helix domain-containing protein [Geminocystis sp. CENA526]|uniref:helix-turn-helix domain-containing protein n=1 Tax=Geminocystis sp. CENA526 TaxID=1355871 RepID=UPI003D6F9279
MTLTFSPEKYGSLLAQYQPKPITTEAENESAIALAQTLEHKDNLTQEEITLLELLYVLIEQFENDNYPITEGSPLEILRHLMEENKIKQEELIGIIGSRGVVSEVVNGKRGISKTQAKALAQFFNVDISLFI